MSNNRKIQMLIAVALIVIAFLATISAVDASTPSNGDLAWPLRDESQPSSSNPIAAEELTDYHQRHPELSAFVANLSDTSDYFFRHPELRAAASPRDLTDYYFRHPEFNLR